MNLGTDPLDVQARAFLLLQLPSFSDALVCQWFMAESNQQIAAKLAQEISNRQMES